MRCKKKENKRYFLLGTLQSREGVHCLCVHASECKFVWAKETLRLLRRFFRFFIAKINIIP